MLHPPTLGAWLPPHVDVSEPLMLPAIEAEADAMHSLLMRRADAQAGCTEGSEEEAELKAIVDALEAYEIKRWPLRKEPGGKG